MTRLGVAFDIVLDLTTFGVAKADDTARLASIIEGHELQAVAFWDEANHSQFFVLEALVNPNECFVPGKLWRKGERQPVRGNVDLVFGGVEFEAHVLV